MVPSGLTAGVSVVAGTAVVAVPGATGTAGATGAAGSVASAGAPTLVGGSVSDGSGFVTVVEGSGGMPFGAIGVGIVPLVVSALKYWKNSLSGDSTMVVPLLPNDVRYDCSER